MVIKTIADVVGKEHPVDLTTYDLVILVTVLQVWFMSEHCLTSLHSLTQTHFLQNVIGISVVGSDYDQLKRYNLAEIYAPTPKPKPAEN